MALLHDRIHVHPQAAEAGFSANPLGGDDIPTVSINLPARAEQGHVPTFSVRPASHEDIKDIVEVDIRSFARVYKDYPETQKELRARLAETFEGRLNLVSSYWMTVLEKDGKIVGFMTSCPTNKKPEDFKSWEDTTDNGTLQNTYDEDGKNVYVVTLSVLPEGSDGKDMLYADQIGKMLSSNKTAFFESRIPGFRLWAVKKARLEGTRLNNLSREQLDTYAQEYFSAKITDDEGKEVPLDPLLRFYVRIGCKLLKVVPDAYQDAPSLNYGVVGVYDGENLFDGSSLPVKLPQNKATRQLFGKMLQKAANSQRLTARLFGGEPLPPANQKQSVRERIHKNRWKLLFGAMAVSAAVSIYNNPTDTLEQGAIGAGGVVALETVWIASGAAALGATGLRVKPQDVLRHPLKVRDEVVAGLPAMAAQAKDSKLFWRSFWTNRAAAVGEFAVPAFVVCTKLPPESWGILAPSAFDLYLTYKFGKMVVQSIGTHAEQIQPEPTTTEVSVQ